MWAVILQIRGYGDVQDNGAANLPVPPGRGMTRYASGAGAIEMADRAAAVSVNCRNVYPRIRPPQAHTKTCRQVNAPANSGFAYGACIPIRIPTQKHELAPSPPPCPSGNRMVGAKSSCFGV